MAKVRPIQFDEFGREIHNKDKPKPLRAKIKPPNSLLEDIRAMVRTELSSAASAKGHESFEEANDFDVDDDSPDFTKNAPHEEEYEGQFEQEVEMERMLREAKKNPPSQLKKKVRKKDGKSPSGNRRDGLGLSGGLSESGDTKGQHSEERFED